MDAIVSGRISAEMKDRGARILSEIGATQSQLIKAAYEYLLAEGRLPKPAARLRGPAALSERDIADLERFVNGSTVAVDPSFWEDFDCKVALEEGRGATYEALA